MPTKQSEPTRTSRPRQRTRDDRQTVKIKTVTGEVLRAHRKNSKRTQKDLGGEADRDPVYISNIERGLQSPTLVTLFKMIPMLDVPLWQLIKEIEERLAVDQQNTER